MTENIIHDVSREKDLTIAQVLEHEEEIMRAMDERRKLARQKEADYNAFYHTCDYGCENYVEPVYTKITGHAFVSDDGIDACDVPHIEYSTLSQKSVRYRGALVSIHDTISMLQHDSVIPDDVLEHLSDKYVNNIIKIISITLSGEDVLDVDVIKEH